MHLLLVAMHLLLLAKIAENYKGSCWVADLPFGPPLPLLPCLPTCFLTCLSNCLIPPRIQANEFESSNKQHETVMIRLWDEASDCLIAGNLVNQLKRESPTFCLAAGALSTSFQATPLDIHAQANRQATHRAPPTNQKQKRPQPNCEKRSNALETPKRKTPE